MPREDMVFFLDRSLGKSAGSGLIEKGKRVLLHDDVFPQSCLDEVWLQRAGTEGWVILTADKKIHKRAIEIAAVKKFKCRLFVFVSKHCTGKQISDALVNALSAIEKIAASSPPPFIAKVYKNGTASVWKTEDQL